MNDEAALSASSPVKPDAKCQCEIDMRCPACQSADAAHDAKPDPNAEMHDKAAAWCDKHKPQGEARMTCLVCSLTKLSYALSRIDYLLGPPNEMETSRYDSDCDEHRVVSRAQEYAEIVRRLEEALLEFGKHPITCWHHDAPEKGTPRRCNCGLGAILADAAALREQG